MKAVQKQTKTLGGWVKKNSDQFKKMGKMIGIAGIAAAGALAFIVKRASDAQEITSKFMTVFAAVMAKASAAVNELTRSYGLSRVASKELLGMTGDLLSGLGVQADMALDLSLKTQKLAVDLASFSNFAGGAKGASEALTKAMLGERESVKALGIVITEEMVKEQLALEGKEKLTGQALLQAKAYATLQIATKQSQLAIGDYARTSTSLANITRTLLARLDDLWVLLGEHLVPVFAALTTELTKFVEDTYKHAAGNTKKFAENMISFFIIITKGIEGLMLAWHSLQVVIFKGAEFVVKAIKFQIDALTAPFELLAKLPGYGELIKPMLKAIGKHTADLTTISEGYNETAGEQIEKLTDIVFGFDKFINMLERVSDGIKKSKKDVKSFGEAIGETGKAVEEPIKKLDLWATTIGKIFHDTSVRAAEMRDKMRDIKLILPPVAVNMPKMSLEDFEEWYKKWEADLMKDWPKTWKESFQMVISDAAMFTSALGGLFNQMTENQIMNIEKEYEARKLAIENSLMTEKSKTDAMEKLDKEFEKKRKKAMRAQAMRTKAVGIMEAIIHTASAVVEALPNIPLAIAVGIMGAVQTALIAAAPLPSFQRGGRIEEAGIVGEAGPEIFVPGRPGEIIPIRERARALGAQITLTFSPTFYLSTLDPQTARDVVRDQIGPEMLEMFKTKILLPEFQTALGIR